MFIHISDTRGKGFCESSPWLCPLLAFPPWAIRHKLDHFCLRHLTQGGQGK